MIPVVTEIAAAAQGELKASDSPRRIAPSVDKFAEHLRKPKPTRSEQESSAKPKTKHKTSERAPAERQPTQGAKPARESRNPAEQKGVDAKEVDSRTELTADSEEEKAETGGAALPTNGAGLISIQPAPESQPVLARCYEDSGGPFTRTKEAVSAAAPMASSAVHEVYVSDGWVVDTGVPIPAAQANEFKPEPLSGEILPTTPNDNTPEGSPTADQSAEFVNPVALAAELTSPLNPDTSFAKAQLVSTPIDVDAPPQKALTLPIPETTTAFPTESAEVDSKPAKGNSAQTFAQYLFGEADSRQSVAPISEIGAATHPKLEANAVAEDIDGSTASDEQESPKAPTVERLDAHSLLTPLDAAQSAASTIPLSLRRHLESQAPAASAAPTGPMISDAQHARLLQRVSRAFRAAEERGGEVQIRLSPPELGSMKLELTLSQGVLVAKLEVENQRAHSILVDSLPALKERLAEQGIRVEQFDVNLPQRDSGGGQPQHDRQSPSDRQFRPSAAPNRRNPEPTPHENVAAPRPSMDASRLNVMV